MKSESWLIIELVVFLTILGVMSFFFVPAYEKGAWYVIGAVSAVLSTVIGYKFGKNMPQQAGASPKVEPPPVAPVPAVEK